MNKIDKSERKTINAAPKLGIIKHLSQLSKENYFNNALPIKGPTKLPKYQTAETKPIANGAFSLGNISVKADLDIGDNPCTIPKTNLPATVIQ